MLAAPQEWNERYEAWLSNIEEKSKYDNKQPNKIDECMDEMEMGLLLQGATANEDKLQEDVPDTIARLAEAGIKIWMLTGDKQETAINIGFATQMLTTEMEMLMFTSEALSSVSNVVPMIEAKAVELQLMNSEGKVHSRPLALIIDEKAMNVALQVRIFPDRPSSHNGLCAAASRAHSHLLLSLTIAVCIASCLRD